MLWSLNSFHIHPHGPWPMQHKLRNQPGDIEARAACAVRCARACMCSARALCAGAPQTAGCRLVLWLFPSAEWCVVCHVQMGFCVLRFYTHTHAHKRNDERACCIHSTLYRDTEKPEDHPNNKNKSAPRPNCNCRLEAAGKLGGCLGSIPGPQHGNIRT